tara:strand:- start:156 stop:839 length:684 start_codon:yes stop_codon:yes gene_type:complete
MSKVIITQSNYIPWKGYFSAMREATHLVLYDDMQYTKRDWRNRNMLITPNGPKWLSIPINVKGKYHQKINKTQVSDNNWGHNHWNFIKNNYIKSPYFKEYQHHFIDLYLNPSSLYLSDINLDFIKKIITLLEIDIKIISSKEFNLKGDKTEKLVNVCKELNAEKYYTGPAAKNYMDESLFINNNIEIEYYNSSGYPEYKQQWDGFDHAVSILDMFFNLGPETIKYFN